MIPRDRQATVEDLWKIKLALAHRFGETANGFFPAPAGRGVWNNRDLLDPAFLNTLDLRAALIDSAGNGKLVDQPVGNDFGMIRLLVHVVVVIVGFADLFQNFLFVRIQYVRQRMRDNPGDVGFHRIFRRSALGNGTGDPKHETDVSQFSSSGLRAGGDFL